MPINIKNFLKEKLAEASPSIDAQEGSGVGDLLLNPLSQIISRYDSQNANLIAKFSKINIEDLTNDEMKSLALSFLISKNNGVKATGAVVFYYATSSTILIHNGAIISYGDKRYEVIGDYTISKGSLIYESPYYKTPNIPILAVSTGVDYNLPAGTNFELSGYASKTPVKISNLSPISSGTDDESNYDLYKRIQTSLFGQFLSSPTVIENYLKSVQTSIKNVDIVGYGNPLLYRDIVYDVSADGNYNKADYRYVTSGVAVPGKDKLNKAYFGQFNDTNDGVGVGFPTSYTAWSTEFTDDMYKGLYHSDDLDKATTTEVADLEAFTSSATLPVAGLGSNATLTTNGWNLKDGISKDNEIVGYGDIVLIDDALRLGHTTYTYQEIENVKDQIKDLEADLITHNISPALVPEAEKKLKTLIDQLSIMVENVLEHNPSPVITKQIDNHTGIKIETTVATTDGTEEGSLSYINVLKNNLIMTPHDGYGAAWKKQPEYLIRLDKDEYASETEKQLILDLAQFKRETGMVGTNFRGRISGNRGTIHPDAISKVWKYNVYVVDNNLLEDEVWVSSGQIWDQASGRDQFLAAGKIWMEQEIEYNLKVEISEDMGIKVWVDPLTNTSPIAQFGPTTPTYIPDANADISVGAETAQRNHVGIGVVNTHNYEWFYKNLIITPTLNVFPGHLFKIDVSNFTPSSGISYYYSGTATEAPTDSQVGGNSEIQLAIYNFNTTSWEVLGTSTVALPNAVNPYIYANNLISDTIITGNGAGVTINALTNYIDNNYAYFAAMPVDDTINLHELRTYYFEINDGEYTGVNRGNAVDIYVNDPDNVINGSFEAVVNSQEINFTNDNSVNGYIQEILNVSEAYSNISLDKTEWAITNSPRNRGQVFSKHNKFRLKFASDLYNGSKMRISYRYWSKGSTVDTYIQDSDVRQPAVDYMLKVAPPTTVVIENLNYSGDISLNTMKLKITDFINSISGRIFEKSDLVNYMYEQGATYVDLDMTVSIRSIDSEMQTTNTTLTSQSYTISSDVVSRFYTHIDELYGVTKL